MEDIKLFNRPSLREGRTKFFNPLGMNVDKVMLLVVVVSLVVVVLDLVVVVLDLVVDGVVLAAVVGVVLAVVGVVLAVVFKAFAACLLIRNKFSARLLSG